MVYKGSGTAFNDIAFLERLIERFPTLMKWLIPHGRFGELISPFLGYFHNPLEAFQFVPSNMDPTVIRRIYKYGFHAISPRLLLHLSDLIKDESGLKDRSKSVYYLHRLIEILGNEKRNQVPISLVFGSKDQQCPPKAVINTMNALFSVCHNVSVRGFGKEFGQADDYGHFDL